MEYDWCKTSKIPCKPAGLGAVVLQGDGLVRCAGRDPPGFIWHARVWRQPGQYASRSATRSHACGDPLGDRVDRFLFWVPPPIGCIDLPAGLYDLLSGVGDLWDLYKHAFRNAV